MLAQRHHLGATNAKTERYLVMFDLAIPISGTMGRINVKRGGRERNNASWFHYQIRKVAITRAKKQRCEI